MEFTNKMQKHRKKLKENKSDELTHNKVSVWVFLKTIIQELTTYAGHLRNRYNLHNLCMAAEDFGVDITWSFFPTSHGKGAVDGIGAVVKRTLWTSVKARKIILNTPRDFYEFLNKKGLDNVKLVYLPKEDVSNMNGCWKQDGKT